jgi:hypothetical protein
VSPLEFICCHDWLLSGSVVTVKTDYVAESSAGGRKLLQPGEPVIVLGVVIYNEPNLDDEFRIDLLTQEGIVVQTLSSRDFIAILPAYELWAIDSFYNPYDELEDVRPG